MHKEDLSYGLFLSDRQLDFLSNYPQGFDRMKCFATFLQMAVKEPTHYEKKEYSVDLTPGQFAISEVELAKLWKCNCKTASKMVDKFHEVGLVSSVPNCRTTVFTVHCLASWYFGNQVIRNAHYSRHPQIEQRIKANHKIPQIATCNVDKGIVVDRSAINSVVTNGMVANGTNGNDANESNFLSLSSNQIDMGISAHHSDEQTIEQRDEYTSKHSEPVSRYNSKDDNDRESKQFNNGAEPTIPIKGSLSPSITLTEAASGTNSTENVGQPFSESSGNTTTDATATATAETNTDNAV